MISALVLALAVDQAASVDIRWSGRLTIGPRVYAIEGRATPERADGRLFSLKISGPEISTTVSGRLSAAGGELYLNGAPAVIPAKTAQNWLREVRNRFAPTVPLADFECREAGGLKTCDSRAAVQIDPSLSGKFRLVYNLGRLRDIRFFSLAEWTNPFGEYVSLSLQIE